MESEISLNEGSGQGQNIEERSSNKRTFARRGVREEVREGVRETEKENVNKCALFPSPL